MEGVQVGRRDDIESVSFSSKVHQSILRFLVGPSGLIMLLQSLQPLNKLHSHNTNVLLLSSALTTLLYSVKN